MKSKRVSIIALSAVMPGILVFAFPVHCALALTCVWSEPAKRLAFRCHNKLIRAAKIVSEHQDKAAEYQVLVNGIRATKLYRSVSLHGDASVDSDLLEVKRILVWSTNYSYYNNSNFKSPILSYDVWWP
jgi:hypothetical protein